MGELLRICHRWFAASVLIAVALGVAGCGGSSSQSYTDGYQFAKTFALPSGDAMDSYCSSSWQMFQNPNGATGYAQSSLQAVGTNGDNGSQWVQGCEAYFDGGSG
jgi:hypothetical protein